MQVMKVLDSKILVRVGRAIGKCGALVISITRQIRSKSLVVLVKLYKLASLQAQ